MPYTLPKGHHTLTPGASVLGANDVLQFVEAAFGGQVVERYDAPDGSVAHAEIMVKDSIFMLGEASSESEARPAMLSFYVTDAEAVDSIFEKSINAGAIEITAPDNQFYGHRTATVQDPGGNRWTISAVVEQLTVEEINNRMEELFVDE